MEALRVKRGAASPEQRVQEELQKLWNISYLQCQKNFKRRGTNLLLNDVIRILPVIKETLRIINIYFKAIMSNLKKLGDPSAVDRMREGLKMLNNLHAYLEYRNGSLGFVKNAWYSKSIVQLDQQEEILTYLQLAISKFPVKVLYR